MTDKIAKPNLDRRKLLTAGVVFALPLGGLSLLSGCQQSNAENDKTNDNKTNDEETSRTVATDNEVVKRKEESKGTNMQIQYLEIVTPEVDALRKQYSDAYGMKFGDEPDMNLGNAYTAELSDGGMIGIRGPLRDTETPVIRPYFLVEDLDKAVTAAADAGAEIAIAGMDIPGHGKIAIVIQGGIETGMWQN